MTKAAELRQKKPEELRQLLLDLRKEQFNLRMQQGTGQTGRPSQVRSVRRDIARIKTLLTGTPAPAGTKPDQVETRPAKAKGKAAKAKTK